jgi:hypothetical protein
MQLELISLIRLNVVILPHVNVCYYSTEAITCQSIDVLRHLQFSCFIILLVTLTMARSEGWVKSQTLI